MLGKLEKGLRSILLFVVFITTFTMVAGVVIQVILRSFFQTSIVWMDEFARYMFIWSAFIGAGLASRDKLHPVMDLLVKKIPGKSQKFYRAFLQLLILTFLGFLIYMGFKLVSSPSVLNQVSSNLRLPMFIMYSVIPISAILMFIYEIIGFKHIFSNEEPSDEQLEQSY